MTAMKKPQKLVYLCKEDLRQADAPVQLSDEALAEMDRKIKEGLKIAHPATNFITFIEVEV